MAQTTLNLVQELQALVGKVQFLHKIGLFAN
jgi:hypothetical protein